MNNNPSKLPAATAAPGRWRDLLLIALAFGALYFFRLGSYPFSNPDEGRNAEIPREMLVSGDWVTPRLNDVVYFEKPPLVYWATAGLGLVFGLNEWTVRAVPVLFALGGVLLTYLAGRSLYGRDAGLWAAVVLGTALLWFVVGHIPILDTAVSVLMAATLVFFILGVREAPGTRRRLLFYGLYASAALATLTKGLMGFLVTGAVMFLWLLVFNQWKRLRPLHLPTGVILFLAITLPWHLLAAMRNETWAHRYLVYEHFERFFTEAASRPGPWYYFLIVILVGLIPWTGFLGPALRGVSPGGWAHRKENADAWFLVTWAAFILFFFSISKSKLPPYILPMFPALAILIGRWFAQVIADQAPARLRVGLGFFSLVCGVLAVALCVVVLRPALVKLSQDRAVALQGPAFTMAAVLLLGGIVAPALAKIRGVRWALGGVATTVALFLATLQWAAPAINKPSTKELALYVKAHARPGDRVFHCYDFFQDFTFYAERFVGVVGRNVAELQLEEDPVARTSGRFITDAELLQQWSGAGRIFLVVNPRKIEAAQKQYAAARQAWEAKVAAGRGGAPQNDAAPERPIFAEPTFRYHLIAQTPAYTLLSNQP